MPGPNFTWFIVWLSIGVLSCNIDSFRDLDLSTEGEVIVPSDEEFFNATKLQNKIFDGKFTPLVIIYCAIRNDVVIVFRLASKLQCPIALRTGGHSFGGFSGGDGQVLLDFSRMRKFTISDSFMTVEPGILNEDVINSLIPQGKFFGTGGCPTVAMGGYIQGGGWGNGLRTYGLAADSLLSADMLLPNGKLITTNETSYADLFWAIRGGGGSNWGIVLEYKLQVYPLPSSKAWSGNITFPISSIDQVFSLYQHYLEDESAVSRGMEFNLGLTTTEVQLVGNLLGNSEESRAIIDAFSRISGAVVNLALMAWEDMLQYPDPDPWDSMPPFLWHSGIVMKSQSTEFTNVLSQMAKQYPAVNLQLESLGGKVSDISPTSTAYYWREALFQIVIFTKVQDMEDLELLTHQSDTVYKELYPFTKGAYVNDMDVALPNWEYSYYGENHERLRRLKRKYNPEDVFRFPQSIPIEDGKEKSRDKFEPSEFDLLILR